jgi:hypothetical protein
MARTKMAITTGAKVAEHLSVGLLAKTYRLEQIRTILQELDLQSKRVRGMPNDALVYYIIALGLFMSVSTEEVLSCLVEGMDWLHEGEGPVRPVGKVAISQARTRLGAEPVKKLWESSSRLLCDPADAIGFYRGFRLMAIDGSTLDVADTQENDTYFGRQNSSRGQAAFPQLRFVGLCECGSRSLHAVRMGPYATYEGTLGEQIIEELNPGMLCLADRLYMSYKLWKKASATGAHLLWRMRANARLRVEQLLDDGSYLAKVYPDWSDHRRDTNGIMVRVIEYRLEGVEDAESVYRLATTILDPQQAPAVELAGLYCQRWEVETLIGEFKTHMRGGQVVLRSKTPTLVEQEFYGMMLAHRAVRTLMKQAASLESLDPRRLSFSNAIRVIRRKLISDPGFPPSQQE